MLPSDFIRSIKLNIKSYQDLAFNASAGSYVSFNLYSLCSILLWPEERGGYDFSMAFNFLEERWTLCRRDGVRSLCLFTSLIFCRREREGERGREREGGGREGEEGREEERREERGEEREREEERERGRLRKREKFI